MADTIQSLARGLAMVLQPFAEALASSSDDVVDLVAELGYTLPGAAPPSLMALQGTAESLLASVMAVEERALAVEDGDATESDLLLAVGELVLDVGLLVDGVRGLPGALAGELGAPYVAATQIDRDFTTRLYDYLLIRGLGDRLGLLADALYLAGVVELTALAADPARHQPDFVLHRMRWERLPALLSDPGAVLAEVYGWGTPDLAVERLYEALERLSFGLQSPVEYGYPGDEALQALDVAGLVDPADGPDPELIMPFYLSDEVTLEFVLYPLPKASAGEAQGLALTLRASGALALEVPLADLLRLEVEAGADLATGLAVALRPGQPPRIVENVSSGGAASILRGARAALRLVWADAETPLTLIGAPGGSAVEARAVSLALAAEASGAGVADLGVEAAITGGKIAIRMDEADGFLKSLVPPEGFAFDFDFLVGWSATRGVYFRGSGGLETVIPLHYTLGPVTLASLYLALAARAEALALEVSVTGNAVIGPVTATVERIGLQSTLAFTDGNLGPVGLGVGFKFPTGLGIAIEAGPIVGGGFLSFDPQNGRYAGLLQLEAYALSITAIGLLDTRGPDGGALPPPGFSFLIIVAVEFPPIQLSYGFTLNGVGGLAGIHRTIVTEALQAGLRAGAVDHILFPEDPLRNAPQIVSDLRTIFPPAPNRFVFGPMLILGWGTPSLVTAEIAVIIELPAPIRIILLGQLASALPSEDVPIVSLHVDVLGILDFDRQSLSIDATLRDSRLAAYALSGDMAMRLSWGAEPNFALAVGGLNPAFQPPPGFPTLRRLTVSLGLGDNPRISLQSYLAITSNSLQFGALAELYAAKGSWNIYGWVGFDALVIFVPFSFRADLSAGFALRKNTRRIAGIHVNATLTGPSPYHAWGKGCVSLFFFDVCVPFDASFGATQAITLPPLDPWERLREALEDARNWSGTLPAGVLPGAALKSPPAGTELALVHPMGAANLHQKVLPLNRALDKVGEFQIEGAKRFDVQGVQVGDDPTDDWRTVDDFFAPAQFLNLSDAEKLSRASFEKMPAGVAVGSQRVEHGPEQRAEITYETRIIDSAFASRVALPYRLLRGELLAMTAHSAKARSAAETSGPQKFGLKAGLQKGFALDDEAYVVVDTATLDPVDGFGQGLSQGVALERLKAHLVTHPEDRGRLQVVPAFEMEEA